MKILVATEKPFASAAVEGIKKEAKAAGHDVVLLESYTEKQQLLDAVADVDAMIVRSDKVTSEVLDAAKNSKLWCVQGLATILLTRFMLRKKV